MTLMDGVTLIDIICNNNDIGIILLALFAVATGIFGVIGLRVGLLEDEPSALGAGIISIFLCVLLIVFGAELDSTNGEIHYKVLVDSNVNYTELIDKYEIIDIEDSVFILKEKGE